MSTRLKVTFSFDLVGGTAFFDLSVGLQNIVQGFWVDIDLDPVWGTTKEAKYYIMPHHIKGIEKETINEH